METIYVHLILKNNNQWGTKCNKILIENDRVIIDNINYPLEKFNSITINKIEEINNDPITII